MASTSPSSADLLAWLAEHPAALEPGLVFYEGALDLGAKLSVPLHGVDPLGRIGWNLRQVRPETVTWTGSLEAP